MHQQDQEEREHDRTFHLSGTIERSVRAGASRKIDELVAGYGATRVMLVTDKGVRGAGLTKGAESSLAAAGIEVSVFDDVVHQNANHWPH